MISSHVVPRFYLEQFARRNKRSARTGHLWVYSRGAPPRRGTALSEAREKGYFAYQLSTGEMDESLESRLACIEDAARDVLTIATNECFVWAPRHRTSMANYVGLMFARSRGRLEGSAGTQRRVSDLLRQLDKTGFMAEIASEFSCKHGQQITAAEVSEIANQLADSFSSEESIKASFVEDLLSNAELLATVILGRQWQTWYAPATREFVTSDTPVVTALPVNGAFAPGFGFNRPGVLIFFPLSPLTCLVIGSGERESRRVAAETVDRVNELIVYLMRRHIYSRDKSPKIHQDVECFGGQAQVGENVFVPFGDHLAAFK